eukprot:TRINITY_DN8536_c0_g1_i1.p1 TRINITY_DN8536_c0_g1~~TRINITY_DN8536_c0_g1_i1.p1  ORF type:complete len:331 (+),score=63.39 TRINITY_DN8536_c0_g1_i1:945-1937(+)
MSGNDDSLSLSESFAAGEEMVALVGCGGTQVVLDCLRNLPALDLVNLQTAVYNQSMRALQAPVADGFELAVGSTLKQRWLAGKIRHRLLVGHNVNDISLFLVLTLPELLASIKGDPVISMDGVRSAMRRLLPSATASQREALLHLYLPRPESDNTESNSTESNSTTRRAARRAFFDMSTDGYFGCAAKRAARGSVSKNFRYVFAAVLQHPLAALGVELAGFPRALRMAAERLAKHEFGAFHGANQAVFWRSNGLSSREVSLGDRMLEHWSSFERSGEPLEAWRPSGWEEEALVLGTEGDVMTRELHPLRCRLLDQLDFVWNPPTLNHGPS